MILPAWYTPMQLVRSSYSYRHGTIMNMTLVHKKIVDANKRQYKTHTHTIRLHTHDFENLKDFLQWF